MDKMWRGKEYVLPISSYLCISVDLCDRITNEHHCHNIQIASMSVRCYAEEMSRNQYIYRFFSRRSLYKRLKQESHMEE